MCVYVHIYRYTSFLKGPENDIAPSANPVLFMMNSESSCQNDELYWMTCDLVFVTVNLPIAQSTS